MMTNVINIGSSLFHVMYALIRKVMIADVVSARSPDNVVASAYDGIRKGEKSHYEYSEAEAGCPLDKTGSNCKNENFNNVLQPFLFEFNIIWSREVHAVHFKPFCFCEFNQCFT